MPPFFSLTTSEAVTLSLLSSGHSLYGLQLVEASEGALKRGSVYVTLNRMEEKGLVDSETVPAPPGEQGPPRRRYRITAPGVAALADYRNSLALVLSPIRP